MLANREQCAVAVGSGGERTRGDAAAVVASPEPAAPYFDAHLNAWVVSRYADVLAAFRISSLIPGKSKGGGANPPDTRAHFEMRAETMQALSASQISRWRELLAREADALIRRLPPDQPIDLLAAYARPLGLSLAAWVTNISRQAAEGLSEHAGVVSAAAADPENVALKAEAEQANAELAAHFASGPPALRDSTFVALARTVPCILGNAWYALMAHPEQWRRLRQQPALLDQAMEELLRYAGLVRRLFRTATEDVELNGALIRSGDTLILSMLEANRDPARFACAHQLDIARRDGGHLALGAGLHSCVGANLIRMAAQTITRPLIERFAAATLAQAVEWQGGSTFQSPRTLWVHLREDLS